MKMKARITKPAEKKLICCGLSPERMETLKMCADDFTAKLVTADDGSLTLGQLLDGAMGQGEAPADECLVFAGFERNELNAMLESLKMSGLRIPLKAVLTPHNVGWRLLDLIAELKKEHAQMTGGGAE